MQSAVKKSIAVMGLLFGVVACGPKMQNVAGNASEGQLDSDPSRRETVSVGINLTEKSAGFSLASATSYNMSLTGCASGLTIANITQANPSVSVYKFDRGCLIKLNSFVMNGFTYVPSAGDPFASWLANDVATFEVAGSPTNNYTVVVTSQLANPISGTENVAYSFTQITKGTDESIAKSVVGDSHALSVGGDEAPAISIAGVTYSGMTTAGAGQFVFKLGCDTAVTGVSPALLCSTNTLTSMQYRLVQDTYGSILTAAQAAALFPTGATTVAAANLLPLVAGTFNGGFNTITVNGPNAMHTNPNMLLVVKAGSSYKYFNIDVSTLTYP
jgi:hypothetical protein